MGRTPETRYLQHFTSVARAGFRISTRGEQMTEQLEILRISKQDGAEEVTDTDRALKLLADVYGNDQDQLIEWLQKGMKLQTDFAIYRLVK